MKEHAQLKEGADEQIYGSASRTGRAVNPLGEASVFRGTTHTSHVRKTSRQPVFTGALLHFIPVWGCSSKELHMSWCGVATGTNYCGQSRGLGSQVLDTSYFSFLCCSFTSCLPAVGAETVMATSLQGGALKLFLCSDGSTWTTRCCRWWLLWLAPSYLLLGGSFFECVCSHWSNTSHNFKTVAVPWISAELLTNLRVLITTSSKHSGSPKS